MVLYHNLSIMNYLKFLKVNKLHEQFDSINRHLGYFTHWLSKEKEFANVIKSLKLKLKLQVQIFIEVLINEIYQLLFL